MSELADSPNKPTAPVLTPPVIDTTFPQPTPIEKPKPAIDEAPARTPLLSPESGMAAEQTEATRAPLHTPEHSATPVLMSVVPGGAAHTETLVSAPTTKPHHSLAVAHNAFEEAETHAAAFIGNKIEDAFTHDVRVTLINRLSATGELGQSDICLRITAPLTKEATDVGANAPLMAKEIVEALRQHPAFLQLTKEGHGTNVNQLTTDDQGTTLEVVLTDVSPEHYARFVKALANTPPTAKIEIPVPQISQLKDQQANLLSAS